MKNWLNLKVSRGTTRTVVLIFNLALKFPTFISWRMFLNGLLGNINEREFYQCIKEHAVPMLFCIPGGFLNVSVRCDVHPTDVTNAETFFHMLARGKDDPANSIFKVLLEIVEYKADSVGVYDGKIVVVDYGSSGCGAHNMLLIQRDLESDYKDLIKTDGKPT